MSDQNQNNDQITMSTKTLTIILTTLAGIGGVFGGSQLGDWREAQEIETRAQESTREELRDDTAIAVKIGELISAVEGVEMTIENFKDDQFLPFKESQQSTNQDLRDALKAIQTDMVTKDQFNDFKLNGSTRTDQQQWEAIRELRTRVQIIETNDKGGNEK